MPTSATPHQSVDPLIGRLIDQKYQVEELVARGGMSRIYRAIQRPLGRVVAIKVLNTVSVELHAEMRERFLREAATCASLSHPNVVVVHDYGSLDDIGALYIVMEFVSGRNLLQEIRARGPLEPDRAVRIATEVARALQVAHGAGIIHRDLKSRNIMLVDALDGEAVKLVDFGIAKLLGISDADAISVNDTLLGSPGYMPPEQIAGGKVDARSDIYSLGAVMFEMLSGAPPFKREGSLQTLLAHLKDPLPDLREIGHRPLGEPLVRLVEACLSRTPDQRPSSAAELLQILRQLDGMSQGASLAMATPGPVPAGRVGVGRNDLALGVSLGLGVVGMAMLAVVFGSLVMWLQLQTLLGGDSLLPTLPAAAEIVSEVGEVSPVAVEAVKEAVLEALDEAVVEEAVVDEAVVEEAALDEAVVEEEEAPAPQ